ncbi:MAG: hypothetical protein SGPRY_014826, partial [Prymnesium sp.]
MADDDAYVVVPRVLSDLSILAQTSRPAVYAAFEWFAYQRNTGFYDAWGGSLRNPGGTSYAWRAHAGVPLNKYPGGNAAKKLCSSARARSCFKGCGQTAAQAISANSTALSLRSPLYVTMDVSLPFPFAK